MAQNELAVHALFAYAASAKAVLPCPGTPPIFNTWQKYQTRVIQTEDGVPDLFEWWWPMLRDLLSRYIDGGVVAGAQQHGTAGVQAREDPGQELGFG